MVCVCVCVCVCARVSDFNWAEIMCFKLGLAELHVVKKSSNIGRKFNKDLKINESLEVRVGEAFFPCALSFFLLSKKILG